MAREILIKLPEGLLRWLLNEKEKIECLYAYIKYSGFIVVVVLDEKSIFGVLLKSIFCLVAWCPYIEHWLFVIFGFIVLVDSCFFN